jgi:hypothetical protein
MSTPLAGPLSTSDLTTCPVVPVTAMRIGDIIVPDGR